MTKNLTPKLRAMIDLHRKKRKLLISAKNDIISQTKRLLQLHENTVHEKYKKLVENLSIHSLGLKTRLADLTTILQMVSRLHIAPTPNEQLVTSFAASDRKRLTFWDVQDLQATVELKMKNLGIRSESDKRLNAGKIEGHLRDLANYYREYQVHQQRKVFRKRILQFFDSNIHDFCRMINSRDFENTLQLKSSHDESLSRSKDCALGSGPSPNSWKPTSSCAISAERSCRKTR